jgi:hypothetical protein
MIIIYEIPLIVIFLLLMAVLVGISAIVNNIAYIIMAIIVGIIYFGMFALLFKTFSKLYEKQKNKAFFIGFITTFLFWFLGPLYYMGLSYLDKNGSYMEIFGDNKLLRYLVVPLSIVLIVSLCILLVAYNCKHKIIQSMFCILSAVFIISFSIISANVCAKSYSDFTVNEIAKSENVVKYTIKQKAEIYFPASSDNEYVKSNNVYRLEDAKSIICFPLFCPIKYTSGSFEVGDVVYVKEEVSLNNREYIKVSDGEKAGYIKTESIK